MFRPPRKGMLLAVFVGSGVQVLFMTVVTLGNFIKTIENYIDFIFP